MNNSPFQAIYDAVIANNKFLVAIEQRLMCLEETWKYYKAMI